jgi:glutamate-1-semialdehyde 2,1-aminomutase
VVQQGLVSALVDNRIRGCVQRVGSLFTLFFGVDQVSNWSDAERTDRERFRSFFFAMLERGFYLPPSPFEACFISLAHTRSEVDAFVAAAREAMRAEG